MKDIWESLPEWAIKDERKKYIFGTKTDSMSIFLMTLTENVYVTAFIQDEYEQTDPRTSVNSLFNKKIISFENAENNSVVFCPDDLENIDLIKKQVREKNCRLCRVGVQKIADDILNNDVVIYGAANRGRSTLKFLRENGVNVIGFADSDKSKTGSMVEDLPVIDFDEIDKDTVVIISSGFYKEIFNKICGGGLRVFVDYRQIFYVSYYPYIIIKSDIQKYDIPWMCNHQFLNLMVHVIDKKIIIDGYHDFGKDFIRILKLMDKTIEYCVDDEDYEIEGSNIEVKNKYDLIYEDMCDKVIIVCKIQYNNDEITYPEADFLDSLGFELNEHYRLLFTLFSEPYKMKSKMIRNRCISLDPISAFAIYHPNTSDKYPQYIVYGNPDTAKIRIMTLGGSTTDGGYFYPIKSWPECLYNKIADEAVSVFNGGMLSYTSREECFKLIRDIESINPDIVISYSGMNDTAWELFDFEHPFYHKFYRRYYNINESDMDFGLKNSESISSLWLRMEKTMKAVTEIHGGKFIGILQSLIYGKKYLTEKEKCMYCYGLGVINPSTILKHQKLYEQLLMALKSKEFIEDNSLYDFTNIFRDNKSDIFFDHCHVFENGNEIIAEEIYRIMKENKYLL